MESVPFPFWLILLSFTLVLIYMSRVTLLSSYWGQVSSRWLCGFTLTIQAILTLDQFPYNSLQWQQEIVPTEKSSNGEKKKSGDLCSLFTNTTVINMDHTMNEKLVTTSWEDLHWSLAREGSLHTSAWVICKWNSTKWYVYALAFFPNGWKSFGIGISWK